MKHIKLSNTDITTIVDDDDYDELSKYSWRLSTYGYSVRQTKRDANGKHTTVQMHRQIMNAPKGTTLDHINRERLDNRKTNLRFVTRSQNSQNTKLLWSNNTSGLKGVYYDKAADVWRARKMVKRKLYCIGVYKTRKEALVARLNFDYDMAVGRLKLTK